MANVEGKGIIARGRNGMKVAAGTDVSKGHLDVSISTGKVKRFVNEEEGVKALASVCASELAGAQRKAETQYRTMPAPRRLAIPVPSPSVSWLPV